MNGYCTVCGFPMRGMHHQDRVRDGRHPAVRWRAKEDDRFTVVFVRNISTFNGSDYSYVHDRVAGRYLCISITNNDTPEEQKRIRDDAHKYVVLMLNGRKNPDRFYWGGRPVTD